METVAGTGAAASMAGSMASLYVEQRSGGGFDKLLIGT